MENTPATQYSNKQPMWQFVLLFITTFGIYQFFWFYRNWKQIYSYNNIEIRPLLRTIGLSIPIVSLILIWYQFIDIKKFAEEKGVSTFRFPGLLAITFMMLNITCYQFPMSFTDKELGLLIFIVLYPFSIIPFLVVQKTLNRYWEKVQSALPVRRKLYWYEILICTVGGIILLILLYDFFLAE